MTYMLSTEDSIIFIRMECRVLGFMEGLRGYLCSSSSSSSSSPPH